MSLQRSRWFSKTPNADIHSTQSPLIAVIVLLPSLDLQGHRGGTLWQHFGACASEATPCYQLLLTAMLVIVLLAAFASLLSRLRG